MTNLAQEVTINVCYQSLIPELDSMGLALIRYAAKNGVYQ